MTTRDEGNKSSNRRALDKFNLGLRLMAGAFILFMLTSLFYLYVAVGNSWNLVANALFDSRILGALWISVSSAFIVGALAIAVAIPTSYILTYNEFRGKQLLETLLIEFPQTFPPATVGLVYLLMLGPGSPINIAYTYPAVLIAKLYVSAPFALSFILRRFREIQVRSRCNRRVVRRGDPADSAVGFASLVLN